ncbi:glycosyltransferase family protein [Balneolales bacterium ANBcel1]|nr:glycosyltransferase family protein [Balneolales bacterium ANBcel1]
MRILYGVQGTGNGHISKANSLIPIIAKYANVDILISGMNYQASLFKKPIYATTGLSFTFGKNGGINIFDTLIKLKPFKFIYDIYDFPISNYDLVISDFEPVTAWASYIHDIPSISVGHQASFLSKKTPRPQKTNLFAEFLFSYFSPCNDYIGIHFDNYDYNIFTPLIHPVFYNIDISLMNHITVYHPAYHFKKWIPILNNLKDVEWHLFTRDIKENKQINNVTLKPFNHYEFAISMASSIGVITAAGFETPAEALHLGKRILSIPMKNQYEQQCNAIALEMLGALTVKKLHRGIDSTIYSWLSTPMPAPMNYPDVREDITQSILNMYKKILTFGH